MKKILFIARNYAPYDNSSGGKALVKIASLLKHDVDIFSLYKYGEAGEVYEHDGVRVFLNRKSYPSKDEEVKGRYDAEDMGLEGFNLSYIKGTIKVLEEIVIKEKYDLIISVCYPFEAHYIASIVSNANHIDWIAWYLDPYYSNYMYKETNRNCRFERERNVLKNCKAIITLPLLEKEYSFTRRQISIDLPFINDFSKEKKCRKITLDKKCRSLLYTGNLYKEYREPNYLLTLFNTALLPDTKLYIVGGIYGYGDEERSRLFSEISDRIVYIDRQSDSVINDLMTQADYLVNIGNNLDNQLPGKVLNYISTGKSIINICKNRACPSLKWFDKYPNVLNLYETDTIEKSIRKLIDFFDSPREELKWSQLKTLYSDVTCESVVNSFDNVICRH